MIVKNTIICMGLSDFRFAQSGNSLEAIHLVDQMYLDCLEMTGMVFFKCNSSFAKTRCISKRENGFTTNSLCVV